jgi:hypothetical protein
MTAHVRALLEEIDTLVRPPDSAPAQTPPDEDQLAL